MLQENYFSWERHYDNIYFFYFELLMFMNQHSSSTYITWNMLLYYNKTLFHSRGLMLTKNISDQRILLITDISVNILALSIASLQLAVSKIFSSYLNVCFHILQSTFWMIWILSYLILFRAFQIDHLDININVSNRSSCLTPILNPNIIFSHLS